MTQTIQITDRATIAGTRMTPEGYLEANVRCVRTGVQQYLASEMGMVGDDLINVYRDEAEVFSRASLDTFSRLPVTVEHPTEMVDAENWKDLARGTTGDEVLRDGEFLKIGMRITDKDAIKAVQDGKREISAGYMTEIIMEDGVAPDGTPYQARQTNIKANHLAIVDAARAGKQARIGDADSGKDRSNWGAAPITDAQQKEVVMADKVQTVVLGDKAATVAVDQAPIIEKFKADQAKAFSDAEAKHKAEIEAKDAELAKAEAALDAEKAKVLSDADIDKRVADRAALITKATAIVADVKVDGVADADIRKAVVVAKLGDEMAAKPAAYIDARFDILCEDAGDAVADALQTPGVAALDMNKAYADRAAKLNGAWKSGKEA